jgi:hypothetical protein
MLIPEIYFFVKCPQMVFGLILNYCVVGCQLPPSLSLSGVFLGLRLCCQQENLEKQEQGDDDFIFGLRTTEHEGDQPESDINMAAGALLKAAWLLRQISRLLLTCSDTCRC